MRVTVIQVESPRSEDVSDRIKRVGQMIGDADASDLIVLPELWAPGYFYSDSYIDRAEKWDGDTVCAVKEWATTHEVAIHMGSFLELSANGDVYNTSAVIEADGSVSGTYRKIHLFGYESQESAILSRGKDIAILSRPDGPLGLTTCYDLRFPELWRRLVDGGARAVATCAAWPNARVQHWQLFTQCRAVEEQIFLFGCNATGMQDDIQMAGRSRIVSPQGEIIFEASQKESVDTVTIDLSEVEAARMQYPFLTDRQLDM